MPPPPEPPPEPAPEPTPSSHSSTMEPPTATFDPYDEHETKAWLDAFAALEEDGEHGHLGWVEAGVHEFELVSGQADEWVSVLKEKANDILDEVDGTDFIEVDQAEFERKLVVYLKTSMVYSVGMLKEEAAENWASSFVRSMGGGKFFRPDEFISMTSHTFDTIFVAVVGTRLAYMLITDED
jgi:hypothetical protein